MTMTTDHIRRRLLTILCIQLMCLYQVSWQGQWERNLLYDLLSEYNRLERPAQNETEPIIVNLGLTLNQIIDVDEKNQILITRVLLYVEWTDDNLKWDPPKYGNISALRIHPYRIWRPDILLYNSADAGFDPAFPTNVIVRSNGRCIYACPGIFKSTCDIDMTWFPFDEQKCAIKFRSWTYDSGQVDLQLNSDNGGNIDEYSRNGEWSLKGVPGIRNELHYVCCPDASVDITFVIHIQRRTMYYLLNSVVPFLLITSMAVFGFLLPPDSREKSAFGVSILLATTVCLNRVAAETPATSDNVPLIANCVLQPSHSVVSTIVNLNYHFLSVGTHDMSPWVRTMFLEWLPWFLRMNGPGHPNEYNYNEMSMSDDRLRGQTQEFELKNSFDAEDNSGSYCELTLILKEIQIMNNKIVKDAEVSETRNEWKFVAMVIDRLCLIFFALFTIIATIALFVSAPQIFVT